MKYVSCISERLYHQRMEVRAAAGLVYCSPIRILVVAGEKAPETARDQDGYSDYDKIVVVGMGWLTEKYPELAQDVAFNGVSV